MSQQITDGRGKETTLPVSRERFAKLVWEGVKRNGLTYREAALRASQQLPGDERISDVSLWSYAKGRSLPRKISHLRAIASVLGFASEGTLLQDPALISERGSRDNRGRVRVEELGDGLARVSIEADLPWEIALQILEIVNGPGITKTRRIELELEPTA